MKMEYNVQILRGWPMDGALERQETIKSGVTLVNGDWVQMQSDGTIDKVSATKTANAGLVIRGNGDAASAAGTSGSGYVSGGSGKALVLWGNFIAQQKTATTFTRGQALTAQSGALVVGTVGTDPIIGYVLDIAASGANQDQTFTYKIN